VSLQGERGSDSEAKKFEGLHYFGVGDGRAHFIVSFLKRWVFERATF